MISMIVKMLFIERWKLSAQILATTDYVFAGVFSEALSAGFSFEEQISS